MFDAGVLGASDSVTAVSLLQEVGNPDYSVDAQDYGNFSADASISGTSTWGQIKVSGNSTANRTGAGIRAEVSENTDLIFDTSIYDKGRCQVAIFITGNISGSFSGDGLAVCDQTITSENKSISDRNDRVILSDTAGRPPSHLFTWVSWDVRSGAHFGMNMGISLNGSAGGHYAEFPIATGGSGSLNVNLGSTITWGRIITAEDEFGNPIPTQDIKLLDRQGTDWPGPYDEVVPEPGSAVIVVILACAGLIRRRI